MKNFLAVLALAALASVAQAQTSGTVENGGAVAGSNSGASSGSVSNAENRAISGSTASGVADTSSGAAAGANSYLGLTIEATQPLRETRSIVETRQSGTATLKTAPGIAMSGPASGPCTGRSGGIGGSWLGGGIGLNYAEVDRGCALRENARMFAMILPTLAGEDQAEARAMLMDTLRTMHAEQNTITKK